MNVEAKPEKVAALAARIGNRTERRIEALRWTGEGKVRYDAVAAEWVVSGEAIGGWGFRTFAELRKSGAIQVAEPKGKTPRLLPVALSQEAVTLLSQWLDESA